jgi:hypothetical protein
MWHNLYIGCLNDVSGIYWPGVTIVSGLLLTLSVNVLAGDYPVTSQLSTDWYGYWGPIPTHNWNQIGNDISGVIELDAAMSISWQKHWDRRRVIIIDSIFNSVR